MHAGRDKGVDRGGKAGSQAAREYEAGREVEIRHACRGGAGEDTEEGKEDFRQVMNVCYHRVYKF